MLGGAAVLVGAAGITGVVVSGSSGDDGSDDGRTGDHRRAHRSSRSTRTDLARTEELDGSVGHGAARPLVLAADGTLTGCRRPAT